MISKLSNLKYAESQIDAFKQRFFPKEEDFSDIYNTLRANIKETSNIIAYKLVYTDFRLLLFDKLYFDDDIDGDGSQVTIDTQIDSLTDLMKDLKDFTDRSLFTILMGQVLEVFNECYVDYLSVFLSNVPHDNF